MITTPQNKEYPINSTWRTDFTLHNLKLRTNGRNNSEQGWPNNVGGCCVRLPVAKSLTCFKTLRNNSQQHATICNRVCKRTHHVTFINFGSCWPTMLRPFAQKKFVIDIPFVTILITMKTSSSYLTMSILISTDSQLLKYIHVYTMMWMLRALWLVAAHDLLEYRYMDDVMGNLFSPLETRCFAKFFRYSSSLSKKRRWKTFPRNCTQVR